MGSLGGFLSLIKVTESWCSNLNILFTKEWLWSFYSILFKLPYRIPCGRAVCFERIFSIIPTEIQGKKKKHSYGTASFHKLRAIGLWNAPFPPLIVVYGFTLQKVTVKTVPRCALLFPVLQLYFECDGIGFASYNWDWATGFTYQCAELEMERTLYMHCASRALDLWVITLTTKEDFFLHES